MPVADTGRLRIYYEELGEGEPLLLIAGLGESLLDWGEEVPRGLAPRFRVILFDNRGAGRTDHPPGPYRLAEMAADAAGLLQTLGIASAHVFGASMGGMIAQHLAIDFPERVRRLVLGCTHPGGRRASLAAPEVLDSLRVEPGVSRFEARWLAQRILFTPDYLAANEEAVRLHVLRTTPLRTPRLPYEAQLAAIERTHRAFDRLGQIRAPTLLITGTEDVLIPPANSLLLAENIPDARVVEIPGAAHLFWISHPRETVTLLTDFLSSEAN